MEPSFVQPTPANPTNAPTPLSVEQVNSWQTHGYTLVDGLFPTTLIDKLQASAEAHFPSPAVSKWRRSEKGCSLGMAHSVLTSRPTAELALDK